MSAGSFFDTEYSLIPPDMFPERTTPIPSTKIKTSMPDASDSVDLDLEAAKVSQLESGPNGEGDDDLLVNIYDLEYGPSEDNSVPTFHGETVLPISSKGSLKPTTGDAMKMHHTGDYHVPASHNGVFSHKHQHPFDHDNATHSYETAPSSAVPAHGASTASHSHTGGHDALHANNAPYSHNHDRFIDGCRCNTCGPPTLNWSSEGSRVETHVPKWSDHMHPAPIMTDAENEFAKKQAAHPWGQDKDGHRLWPSRGSW